MMTVATRFHIPLQPASTGEGGISRPGVSAHERERSADGICGDALTDASASRRDAFPVASAEHLSLDARGISAPISTAPTGRSVAQHAGSLASDQRSGAVLFSRLGESARARTIARERAVLRVREIQASGAGLPAALAMAAVETGISARSLRRHVVAYDMAGLAGLVEQRVGRVGRKSIADIICRSAPHILDGAAAKAIEYGTLGPTGAQNIARSVRSFVASHPDLPREAREHLHGGHASKSYVPPSLRTALRVSPQARDILEGPHAERLRSPHTLHDWSAVKAGQIVVGDDMTANIYCWIEWPCDLGYVVFRPQILAWLDVGCLGFLTARALVRTCGDEIRQRAQSGYTADDVWGTLGDLLDQWGLYPEFILEGGAWSSAKIRGFKTGIESSDRIGGLASLGARVRRAYSPRAKPIEERFNQLQYAMDGFPGYCGRRERDDRPEAIDRILAACRAGKISPSHAGLPHFTRDFVPHLERSMADLWAERNDGALLRGRTPQEKWTEDAPVLRPMDARASWMYRSDFSFCQVSRAGQILITRGTGKYKVQHLYRSAEVLQPLSGQRVGVYFNDGNPEADAVIVDRDNKYLGCAAYVDPIPRFGATREQMHDDYAARAEYHRLARAETIRLKPYLDRTYTFSTPDPGSGPSGPTTSLLSSRVSQPDSITIPAPTTGNGRLGSSPATGTRIPTDITDAISASSDRARVALVAASRAGGVDTTDLLERKAARLADIDTP